MCVGLVDGWVAGGAPALRKPRHQSTLLSWSVHFVPDVMRSKNSCTRPAIESQMSQFPTQRIPFNQIRYSQFSHEIQTLGAMVHSVRGNVDQSGTKWLSPGWIIQVIDEVIIFALPVRDGLAERKQFFGNNIQTPGQSRDRARWISTLPTALRFSGHQITPAFHVGDDVSKCPAQRSVTDVEPGVE